MILLTRLNGPVFALNPDLVERADSTPDTVITLVDGTKYVVAESLSELVALIRQYRAGVVADAQYLVGAPAAQPAAPERGRGERREPPVAPVPAPGPAAAPAATPGEHASQAPQAPESNVVQLHRRER